MKRIAISIIILVCHAASLSLTAQETNPPLRGEVGRDDFFPHIEALIQPGTEPAGTARALFSALDARASLREGLRKHPLDGQLVYYAPYAFRVDIMAHRADGSEPQDIYAAGESRHTGGTVRVRESKNATEYVENTEFNNEGFFWTASAVTSHDKDEKSERGSAGIEVWYSPLQVHVKSVEETAPVYEGGVGAVEMLLTDTGDRWCIDGYTFKLTSMNTDIFTVEAATVTTGANGKARIRLHGVKAGHGRLRLYLYLAQPETGSYVQVEEYIDVEVKEPEKWTYDISVHDSFSLPARDYSLHGDFEVTCTLDEADQLHYTMPNCSDVSKSDGGSFNVMGTFMDEGNREGGIFLGFDMWGIVARAQNLLPQLPTTSAKFIGDWETWAETGQMNPYSSDKPITFIMTLLKEGSVSYNITEESMRQWEIASDPSLKERVEQEQREAAEAAAKPQKKEKKKSALRELRDAMRELRELEKDPPKPRPEARQEPEIDPEVVRRNQSAFLQEAGCFVFPDMTQLMKFDFGDVMLEGKASESQGTSWMKLTGSITLHKEQN